MKFLEINNIEIPVAGKVAEYKKLRGGLVLVDELPRGKTGKVLRSMAAQLYGK